LNVLNKGSQVQEQKKNCWIHCRQNNAFNCWCILLEEQILLQQNLTLIPGSH